MSLVEVAQLAPSISPPPKVRDGWSVRVVTDPSLLESEQVAWMDLACGAAETNSFYEPWFFLPAVRSQLAGVRNWQVLILEHTEKSRTQWVGFFPFHETGSSWSPLGRRLQLAVNSQSYLSTPLIRRGLVPEVLDQLFAHLRQPGSPRVMHWPLNTLGGPIHQALIDIVRRDLISTFVRESYNRALLKPWKGPNTEEACQDYLLRSLGGHHFRDLRRQRRRLNEAGHLEFRALETAAEVPVWAEWFLQLESVGWKGRQGTALASNPATLRFAHEIIQSGFEQGRVQMVGLFRQGEPLALKLNLISDSGGFSYKIAYNEEFAKLSPGVQLEVDYVRHFQSSGREWIDSCAVADHSMINRIWAERRTIQDLLISTGHWKSDLALAALPTARAVLRTGRRLSRAVKGLLTRKSDPTKPNHTPDTPSKPATPEKSPT
jgi:hypothetical protein